MTNLKIHTTYNFETQFGIRYKILDISYQVFGRPLGESPIVLINHALTGNSTVVGEKGWWNNIVGDGKVIDTKKYTIIAIDILGNGNNKRLIDNYCDFSLKDIALLQIKVLKSLKIDSIYACIGGSIGGALAWELSVLKPNLIKYLIPIASHWKSTDWIIGHNFVQENILNNSVNPLEDARQMAMLFYRTPESFAKKFNSEKDKETGQYKVQSWLNYHGKALSKRFNIKAYLMVNHLLTTIDITRGFLSFSEAVQKLNSKIIQVGIDTDLFFKAEDNIKTKLELDKLGIPNVYHEIKSIHGHDAFLIEHEQITHVLNPIFN